MKDTTEWFENFFDSFYNRTWGAFSIKKTKDEVDFIEDVLNLTPGQKILDVPCGFGRHAIELAKRGYDVTGIEYNQYQLEQARKLMEQNGVSFSIIKADMRNIPVENTYDKLFNFFTSFGYFSDSENELTIKQFHKALKPGADMLLECMHRDYIVRNFRQGEIVHAEDGSIFLSERKFEHLTSRINGVSSLIEPDGKITERKLSLRIYSLHELLNMFKNNGFEILEVYGENKKEFNLDSPRVCVVARKK